DFHVTGVQTCALPIFEVLQLPGRDRRLGLAGRAFAAGLLGRRRRAVLLDGRFGLAGRASRSLVAGLSGRLVTRFLRIGGALALGGGGSRGRAVGFFTLLENILECLEHGDLDY